MKISKQQTKKNIFFGANEDRYTRGTFAKTFSLSDWNQQQSSHDKLYRKRFETNSLRLKIVQHCKQNSLASPDSPTDEMFKTPNTTIDADDSAVEEFKTPNTAETTLTKMKSMTNLFDEVDSACNGRILKINSMGQIAKENGDTPLELVKQKRDFETKRFNNAKMQSLIDLTIGEDDVDGMINKRHHSDNSPTFDFNRHSLQTPKIFKRVGNTRYVGADSTEDKNYQIMKMRSMNDIASHNKALRGYDPFANQNGGKKYDKSGVVPQRLDQRFAETNGNCDKGENVFKVPENPMIALRKEKSSSSIESMRNRGSSLYDRLR
jgi:hypothetical protein